ncbi:MAG: hypothetical protein ACP5RM_02240 [Candidatus Micrarchaeia archaeon]
MQKAQSAIEFLSTYAFMILIISIALLLLFMFFSIPRTILPPSCNFYSGFGCSDAIYINTTHGSELLIIATDMEPGIINVSNQSGFTAYLGYRNSTSGYCTPRVATAGQRIYCIANFTSHVKLGSTYSGVFRIKANYCAVAPSMLSNSTCPANATTSNYTFGGYLTVSSSIGNIGAQQSGSYYVPITITNTQNKAVPSQFQQMIEFNPSTYATYERSDLGNIRFYYKSTELYSWCEANCSSSSTGNAIFWVKTPRAIPPGKNLTIDMYFLPAVVEYDGDFAGEAPQLSTTYGQYDNGAKVFEFYEGFEGATLPPELNQYAPSGAAISVNKGLTINTGTASWAGVITTSNFTPPVIFDAYVASQSGGALSGGIAEQAGSLPSSPGYDFNGWSGSIGEGTMQNGMSGTQNINLQIAAPGVDSQTWLSSSSQIYYKNYVAYPATSTDINMPSTVYLSAGVYCCSGGDTITFYWIRARDYPPNGVMPSYSLGSLINAQA